MLQLDAGCDKSPSKQHKVVLAPEQMCQFLFHFSLRLKSRPFLLLLLCPGIQKAELCYRWQHSVLSLQCVHTIRGILGSALFLFAYTLPNLGDLGFLSVLQSIPLLESCGYKKRKDILIKNKVAPSVLHLVETAELKCLGFPGFWMLPVQVR